MMTPQDQWLLQKEKVLAWLRVGFALVALALVQYNPTRVIHFPLLSYASLGSFLAYSLVVLYLARRETTHSKKTGIATTCLDVIWVSLVVFSTGGTATPFFVYYFFPIITACSRYGIKGGVSVAIAEIAIYGFIRYNYDWEGWLGIDRFIVRSIYLVVLAYIFGFLSEFEKKQNQKLLALSKTAGQAATFDERRRITRELHDGLLQTLATHLLRLEGCRKHLLESPNQLEKELRLIEHDTRSSMKLIREFLAGKESQSFPPGMLLEYLRGDLKFLRDGLGMQVTLETEPQELDIPESLEHDLYYVLREGLMNIMRHSQASQVAITIKQTDTDLHCLLKDDGVGFAKNESGNGSGMGLASMKERVEKLRGELALESSPGKGTEIDFVLPLNADPRDGETARV